MRELRQGKNKTQSGIKVGETEKGKKKCKLDKKDKNIKFKLTFHKDNKSISFCKAVLCNEIAITIFYRIREQ